MKDCCEDKTSPYDIRPEDAAIGLAERLSLFEESTLEQKIAISQILAFLRNLPAPPVAGLHGEFGFRIELEGEAVDAGHLGSWCVSVCRAMFEIFSCGREGLPMLSWLLCPGHKNANTIVHADEWAAQVENPKALLMPGQRLVVEALTWHDKNSDP